MQRYSESDFKASVGKYGAGGRQCYNTVKDQQMIIDLLNRIPVSYGGTEGKLITPPLWGVVNNDLHQAIVHFQTFYADRGLVPADGHIDPHERTLKVLLKIAYDILFVDSNSGVGTYFPEKEEPIHVGGGPAAQLRLRRSAWRITGSSSGSISLLVFTGGAGVFFLETDYIKAELGYTMAGASLSAIPGSITYGPASMPQDGSSIWSYSGRELGLQDLVGPFLMLSGAGALPPEHGKSLNAIWFNAPLGLGLAARAASLASQTLEQELGRLNESAGGVAYLKGEQWSTPDIGISLTTGIAWPKH